MRYPLHVLAPRRSKAPPTIVIDPGHGGVDPGAIGRTGVREKDVVLAIAEDFAAGLKRLTRASVRLTRQADVFLSLEERVAIAQSYNADVFISVHADSAPEQHACGLSIYTLSEVATDKLSAALAAHENYVGTLSGVNVEHMDDQVTSTLFDLARQQTLNRSHSLQHQMITDLSGKTRLLENPARSANFVVLRSPTVPALLIESGFLSNDQDEALLRKATYRHHLAGVLARSLIACFGAWATP